MLDEVGRNPLEPFVRGDDLVVLAQQLIEQRLLVGVELSRLDLRSEEDGATVKLVYDNRGRLKS